LEGQAKGCGVKCLKWWTGNIQGSSVPCKTIPPNPERQTSWFYRDSLRSPVYFSFLRIWVLCSLYFFFFDFFFSIQVKKVFWRPGDDSVGKESHVSVERETQFLKVVPCPLHTHENRGVLGLTNTPPPPTLLSSLFMRTLFIVRCVWTYRSIIKLVPNKSLCVIQPDLFITYYITQEE
jgi:hypothetical protein